MGTKGDDSKFSLATTVTLALAVAAVVLVKAPLKSSRPDGVGTDIASPSNVLQARARLWEDPFAAVQKDIEARKRSAPTVAVEGRASGDPAESSPSNPVSVELKIRSSASRSAEGGIAFLNERLDRLRKEDEKVTVLIVMTRGGYTVDDSEWRIRDRYAVEAALEAGCFKSEQTQYLPYFVWEFAPTAKKSKSSPPSRTIPTPYEWYRASKVAICRTGNTARMSPADHILLLWVAAGDSDDSILQRISVLLKTVLEGNVSKAHRQRKGVRLVLLGPRSSSEFRSILKEITGRESIEQVAAKKVTRHYYWQQHGGMDLYSPWATAMPGILAYGLKASGEETDCVSHRVCEERFHRLLSDGGLTLRYHIRSDDLLFESLFEELKRRQVVVGKDRIVLIGEWDSFYARALPVTFAAAACWSSGRCESTAEGVDKLRNRELLPEQIQIGQYSYLSGLDGEVAAELTGEGSKQREPKGNERTEKAKVRDIAPYEKPEGSSQLDYVRRLVSRIKAEQTPVDMKQGGVKRHGPDVEPHGRLRAIGILGTDPYDALLILQAVREQFPNVLFFATDLDARYFHESEQKWSRNLLIVSHFGLQLEATLQRSIPPFRSSYQTSAFLAVRNAINRTETDRFNEAIPPRLFEIGRDGAVDLSVDLEPGEKPSVHPWRNDVEADGTVRIPARMHGLWITAVVLLVLMVWGYGRLWNWVTARDETNEPTRRIKRFLAATSVVVIGLAAVVAWCKIRHVDYARDEPLSWSDGVSVWPTELIRFAAAVLCGILIIKARADLVRNTEELEHRFPAIRRHKDATNPCGLQTLVSTWGNVEWMVHGTAQLRADGAAGLWAQYCEAHSWPQRAVRIALWLALYTASILPVWLFLNDGELRLFVPCRGSFSCTVDHFLVIVSVVSLLVLNLAVLDAVWLCARWITESPAANGLNPGDQVRLIVERTKMVNRRILHPFVVLFLLITARSHYIDNWDFPPALVMVLSVNSAVALASACILYLAAVGARQRVLISLQEKLSLSFPETTSAEKVSRGQLRRMMDEISSIQQGAFVPFYQQPVVQATLVGALAFLQYWFLGQ